EARALRDLAEPPVVVAAQRLHVAGFHQRAERLLVLDLVDSHVAVCVLAHDGLVAARAHRSRIAQELQTVLGVVPAIERGFLPAGNGRLDDEEHGGHGISLSVPANRGRRTRGASPATMGRSGAANLSLGLGFPARWIRASAVPAPTGSGS